jgi:hypothetical protein
MMSRRQTLAGLTATGAAGLALPARAAEPATDAATDWAWLVGDWDVRHRRLRERLAGSTEWEEFPGRSALWLTLGGLGTIDDNAIDLPGGAYRALGVRAFDPAGGLWSIWWLDPRNPGRIDPPVRGRFEGDGATFLGEDSLRGRPILVRFQWSGIHGPRPHWRQSFSPDGGATWEMNWENVFTRASATPGPLPLAAGEPPPAPNDWAFLVGRWSVRHRKLRRRLAGDDRWDVFDGTLTNWPVMGGQGNVGDNLFNVAAGAYRGVGLRAWDPTTGDWLSWWLDGRDPGRIGPPVRGGFKGGVGTFLGDDVHEGRPIRARVLWSGIGADSARWEQAFSADGGVSWETNWVSDFTRIA